MEPRGAMGSPPEKGGGLGLLVEGAGAVFRDDDILGSRGPSPRGGAPHGGHARFRVPPNFKTLGGGAMPVGTRWDFGSSSRTRLHPSGGVTDGLMSYGKRVCFDTRF